MAAGNKLTKKTDKGISPSAQDTGLSVIPPAFLTDVQHLITETRSTVAVTVNFGMTFLCWRVGVRIRSEILRYEWAGYGEQHLHALSAKLTAAYACWVFSPCADNLFLSELSGCIRRPLSPYQDFYLAYSQIVGTLFPQLQDLFLRKGIIPGNERGSRGTYKKTGCPFEVRG